MDRTLRQEGVGLAARGTRFQTRAWGAAPGRWRAFLYSREAPSKFCLDSRYCAYLARRGFFHAVLDSIPQPKNCWMSRQVHLTMTPPECDVTRLSLVLRHLPLLLARGRKCDDSS